jgi:hypothetical protein
MFIPPNKSLEKSVLICSNFYPSGESIKRLFFSYHYDDALQLESKQYSQDLSLSELKDIKNYRISEQITGI